jgi:hypothetical protein
MDNKKHIVQVMKLEGPITYDDGSEENFRVRLVSKGGFSKPHEILNTGRGFMTRHEAMLYADGQFMALHTALVDTSIEFIGFDDE